MAKPKNTPSSPTTRDESTDLEALQEQQHELTSAPDTHLASLSFDMQEDMGAGFEEVDKDSMSIPFLGLIQKMSPQADPDSGKYIDGAQAGDIFNSVTGELFKSSTGVLVIPCHYQRKFVEWVPRESGGGFVASHQPGDAAVLAAKPGPTGIPTLPSGNLLRDTRYHFVIILRPDGSYEPAVIGMQSTQLRKSRQWITIMQNVKVTGSGGRKFTPPMFASKFLLTSVAEQNDKGTWKGWRIEGKGLLSDAERDLYESCKAFRSSLVAGAVKFNEAASAGSVDEAGVIDADALKEF